MKLENRLRQKLARGQKIVSIYMPAGFPSIEATLPILRTLEQSGADLVELGVPFSDPLADGSTIQAASNQALKNGITLDRTLHLLAKFKKNSDLPVILMGYANPFMRFGLEQLVTRGAAGGAAGFIIPDLPLEESGDFRQRLQDAGMDLIQLVAPNTNNSRRQKLCEATSGFLYAVSITGVTGAREMLPPETMQFLRSLRTESPVPILAGFGISGAGSAREISTECDGCIIGSAAVRIVAEANTVDEGCERLGNFVREIKAAVVAEQTTTY